MQANMMQQSPQAQANFNGTQAQRQSQGGSPVNPQAVAREAERVTTLLEINSHLIEEVVNLQSQGKAGTTGQQTPTSPTAADGNATPNSPVDGGKKKQENQEYTDCMRRLQANLGYLAQVADANKKGNARQPIGPAIMVPPPHLSSVHPLYQKLKVLFPEASQSMVNKAMAVANAQRAAPPVQAQPQISTQS